MTTPTPKPSAQFGGWRHRTVRQFGHKVVPARMSEKDRTIVNSRRDRETNGQGNEVATLTATQESA